MYNSGNIFHYLHEKWVSYLLGSNLNRKDSIVKRYIEIIDENVNCFANTLVMDKNCIYVFNDLKIDGPKIGTDVATGTRNTSSQISLTYDRLRTLAVAFKTSGSKYYNSPKTLDFILSALKIMYTNHYHDNHSSEIPYGNWYDWEIATPLRYMDLLFLMREFIAPSEMQCYVASCAYFNKSLAKMTGANRVWKCHIQVLIGILEENSQRLESLRESVKSVFGYVDDGDGFYRDGSFVQHESYAYTGGYGKAFLVVIAPLMYLLKDTQYELKYSDHAEESLFDMIFEAYAPLVYNGLFMDMAREREISRKCNQDDIPGRQIIRAMIYMSAVIDGERQAIIKSIIKEYLTNQQIKEQVYTDPVGTFLEYHVQGSVFNLGNSIIEDSSVLPHSKIKQHKTYSAMDRILHRGDNFAFTVSMHSDRIKTYEPTNTEGTNRWHVADGMTYLYTTDLQQYNNDYYAALDMQRLAGTTVERDERFVGMIGNVENSCEYNPDDWVGGCDMDDLYGTAGMFLIGYNKETQNRADGLRAKKSWFMFGNKIVALGCSISGTSKNPVETIIENRRFANNSASKNIITIDGKEAGADSEFSKVTYLHLTGNTGESGSDIGYYFPNCEDIMVLREERQGSWWALNQYEKFYDKEPVLNTYATFWINHGVAPQNAGYAYVLLPGKSLAQVSQYAQSPDIAIIENSENAHAVFCINFNITGINFWNNTAHSVGTITSYNKAAVIIRETNDSYIIAVSDPTQKQIKLKFDISLPIKADDIISKDVEVSLRINSNITRLEVNTDGAKGKSFRVEIKKQK